MTSGFRRVNFQTISVLMAAGQPICLAAIIYIRPNSSEMTSVQIISS